MAAAEHRHHWALTSITLIPPTATFWCCAPDCPLPPPVREEAMAPLAPADLAALATDPASASLAAGSEGVSWAQRVAARLPDEPGAYAAPHILGSAR